MRVSINSPIASLVVDLPEHEVLSLIRVALNYVGKVPEIPVLPPLPIGGKFPEKKVEMNNVIKEALSKSSTPITLEGASIPAKAEYKGFLYIKCEECGKFKGFMPKSPISEYHCDCGHVTKLVKMRAMYANCKCGQKFKYLTNADDKTLSLDCINCGAPIDLEYHDKNQVYQTIESEG